MSYKSCASLMEAMIVQANLQFRAATPEEIGEAMDVLSNINERVSLEAASRASDKVASLIHTAAAVTLMRVAEEFRIAHERREIAEGN